jgi:hypothetical protein
MITLCFGPRHRPSVISTIPADVIGMIAQWVALSDEQFHDANDQMNK